MHSRRGLLRQFEVFCRFHFFVSSSAHFHALLASINWQNQKSFHNGTFTVGDLKTWKFPSKYLCEHWIKCKHGKLELWIDFRRFLSLVSLELSSWTYFPSFHTCIHFHLNIFLSFFFDSANICALVIFRIHFCALFVWASFEIFQLCVTLMTTRWWSLECAKQKSRNFSQNLALEMQYYRIAKK